MDTQKAEKLTTQLLHRAETAYLTTQDTEGFPNTRAMLNLQNRVQFPALTVFHENNKDEIFFTTNTSSAKILQLEKNNKASVYYSVPAEWRGVCLVGTIELVKDSSIKKDLWQDGWSMYYPGGDTDPDYAVLRFKPLRVKGYHQMEQYAYSIS